METTMTARIGDYFKNQNKDFGGFFKVGGDNDKIDSLNKQIKKLMAEVNSLNADITTEFSKKYAAGYEKPQTKFVFKYTNRSGTDFYYTFPDGQMIDHPDNFYPEKNYDILELGTKFGEVEVVVGYNYSLAAIITRKYKYAICDTYIKLTPLHEVIRGFLDQQQYNSNPTLGSEKVQYDMTSWDNYATRRIKGDEFISNLYGRQVKLGYSISDYYYRFESNKSFEVILRTAPEELLPILLNNNYKASEPIYKLPNVDKETYDAYLAKGKAQELYRLREYIKNKDIFHKTPTEWLELSEECQKYQKDLKFYNVNYSNSYYMSETDLLIETLADKYKDYGSFYENYSFGKFIKYVVSETINQGFSGIREFCIELKDYIYMCKQNGVKPNLYTDSLALTHNIASRNMKISLSTDEENTFRSKYIGYTDIELKSGYFVIPPKNSLDIKSEGACLNHCVSSYIKKVIDNECLILFLRKDKDESLITLEIEDNTICQARGNSNRSPNKEEIEAIEEFAKMKGLEVNY